jgi:hypothetical protein
MREEQTEIHTHTPAKWVQCQRNSFFDDLKALMAEFSFSATVPKARIEELMDKYHVTHVHVACGPMVEVEPNEVV